MSEALSYIGKLLPNNISVSSISKIEYISLLLILLLLYPQSGHALWIQGGWGSVGGDGATPDEACRKQWQWAGMDNGYSRFIGSRPYQDNRNARECQWTSFQYLCPQEVSGGGIGTCGTVLPSLVFFGCPGQHTRMFPNRCVPNNSPGQMAQRPLCPQGQTNPATEHPVILVNGTKISEATDFASADNRFVIRRHYRSVPGGYSLGASQPSRGLGMGWQFSFQMELQMGPFSGSPSSPNGNVTVLAPDGSAYDFILNSSGQFVPRVDSGALSFDYKVEFVGTLPSNLGTMTSASRQWRVTDRQDRVWTLETFTNLGQSGYYYGRPTQITERDGYEWTFAYAADTSLSTIVDTFGRTATFTWDYFYITFLSGISNAVPVPEAVASITFPDGTSASYTFDPPATVTPPSTTKIEKLVGITIHDGSMAVADSTTYHYEDPDYTFALTGITDNRNIRLATYAYDDVGRAIRTEGANDQNEYTIEYAQSGNFATRRVTNPLGRETVYSFEKTGFLFNNVRLAAVDGEVSTHCPATETEIDYVGNFISSTTDEEGRITNYTRDATGRPLEIEQAAGLPEERTTTITWDTNYNVPAIIEAPGLTTTRMYNGSGQLASLTEEDTTSHTLPYPTNGQTRTWAYTYTTGGLVATIDGPLTGTGDTVSYTYDADGYVETYTDELSHVTTVNAVNGRGQPTEIEDANGLITTLAYDAVGRLIETVADPGTVAAETTIEYDDTGNVTQVTQPDGSFLVMAYDDNSRVTSISNAGGDRQEFTYDTMGNVTLTEISNGYPQLFFRWDEAFDELGRLIEVVGAGPAT